MADFNNSPQMQLPVPTVGQAPGPDWADLLNACMAIIDGHTHVPGSGSPITPDAININADLEMGSYSLIDTRSVRMIPQGAPIALPTDLSCIYVSGVDLYYNDASGNQVRITQSGAVAGTPGSIANLVSPASASYVGGNSTFVWQSNANTPANMDFASAIMRNLSAGSKSLTLRPPSAMGSDYTVTLPFLPASTSFVSMDSAGTLAAANLVIDIMMPAGAIIPYAGASLPAGRWLLCNGAAVSRTTYSALFAAIGTNNGSGDGSTTFNIPDLRGQFLRGVDGAAGRDPDAASRTAMNTGGNTGNNVGSVQSDEFEMHNHGGGSHTHTIPSISTFGGPSKGILSYNAGGPNAGDTGASQGSAFSTDSTAPISNQGGSETRPINAYVNYLIKY